MTRKSNNTIGGLALYKTIGAKRIMWTSSGDVLVCERCAALDGTFARTGELFLGTTVAEPPRHDKCRCTSVSDPDAIKQLQEFKKRTRKSKGPK